MKTKWTMLSIVLVAKIVFSSHALAGGGTATGDGYPTGEVPRIVMNEMPEQEMIRSAIQKITVEYPSIGYALHLAFQKFSSEEYGLFRVDQPHPYEYASFVVSRFTDEWKGLPSKASIVLWKNFFTDLPTLSPVPGAPSQVKVLLHEFAHVLFVGMDEEAALILGEAFYKIGTGAELSPAEKMEFRRILAALLVSGDPVFSLEELARFYVKNEGGNQPCWNVEQSHPIPIGRRDFSFPVLPMTVVSRLGQDPFFDKYRWACLSETYEGISMRGKTPIKSFLENPYFHAVFIESVLGTKLKLKLRLPRTSGASVYVAGMKDLIRAALPYGRAHPLTEAHIEKAIPGYGEWKRLYLRNASSSLKSSTWVYDGAFLGDRLANYLSMIAKEYPTLHLRSGSDRTDFAELPIDLGAADGVIHCQNVHTRKEEDRLSDLFEWSCTVTTRFLLMEDSWVWRPNVVILDRSHFSSDDSLNPGFYGFYIQEPQE